MLSLGEETVSGLYFGEVPVERVYLGAQSAFCLEHPESTITRHVFIVWADEGNEDMRPDSVTVDLLRDGKIYRTVQLSAGNNWRASWTGLSPMSQWQVVERMDSEDYFVSIERHGSTFVVTNTYNEEITDPDEPPL